MSTGLIPHCDCTEPGFCPHFLRVLSPSDLITCRRTDDKGKRIRSNWAREAGLLSPAQEPQKPTDCIVRYTEPAPILKAPSGVRKILLENNKCAGDVLVSTAALESVATLYPGRFWIGVDAHDNQPILESNPHVVPLRKDDPEVETVSWDYPMIHESQARPVHFMDAYTASLATVLGVSLYTTVNRPYVYLSDDEKAWTNQVQEITKQPTKFWLINSGFKNCFTTKAWLPENYQSVVDAFIGRITFVQIGRKEHNHLPLRGVINLLDKTDLRQLIRLAYHAQGCLGPSTFLQHLAAAHEKPYVLVDSAREPAAWMSYPKQTSLVQHAKLTCCSGGSCWKSRTVAINDGKDGNLCEQPWFGGSVPIPRCSAMIQPGDVVKAIASYYDGGSLSY